MKKHRWFFSLVALLVVFSLLQPIAVAAASVASIDITDYKTGSSTSNGLKIETYSYSAYSKGTRFNRYEVTDSSGNASYFYDTGYTAIYSASTKLKTCRLLLAYCDSKRFANSSNLDGFLFQDAVSVSYFRKMDVQVSLTLSSTSAVSGTAYLIIERGSGKYLYSLSESSVTPFSLSAGGSKTLTFSVPITNFLSSDYILPYFNIRFDDVPSGAEVSASTKSVDFVVTSGEDAPVYPTFTSNVGGSVTYIVGDEADALSVSASVSDGGTLSYQWYKNNEYNSSTGSAFYGGTSKKYTPPTDKVGVTYYYCVVTNTKGSKTSSSTSGVVTVRVIEAPRAPQITQNLSTAILEYERNAAAGAFTVSAVPLDGGTLSFQWYSNIDASNEGGTAISGATKSTYTPSTKSDGLKYYYCVITNTVYGYQSSVASNAAGVRVVPPPDPAKAPAITKNLSTEEVVYTEGDAAAALRIGASSPDGGVLSYKWYQIVDGITSVVAGETLAVMTPDTSTVGTTYYYCVVTNTVGKTSASTTSARAMITVEKDNTETLLGSIIGGISNIWEGIQNMWESIKELPTKITEGLSGFFESLSQGLTSVYEGIISLPQTIMEGLKNLFVPDPEYMADYQEQWNTLLADRFGALYESVTVVSDFYATFSDTTAKDKLTVPSVTVNLAGTPFAFGGWDVDLVPDGFDFLVTVCKRIVSILCTLWFINALRNRFERVLGGGNA